MLKVTQKVIKEFIAEGIAEELTSADMHGKVSQVAYSCGAYGINGALFRDKENRLYAIPCRGGVLWQYC